MRRAINLPAVAWTTSLAPLLRPHRRPLTSMSSSPRPPVPPFTKETAIAKVRAAENAWNGCDASKVCLAYTADSRWRNRSEFVQGRQQIEAFLQRKWQHEKEYRLIKELWTYNENRIAVRFAYECFCEGEDGAAGGWKRCYGNENWEFDRLGLMKVRIASINDISIREEDRLFRWPLGVRPLDHAGLSELAL